MNQRRPAEEPQTTESTEQTAQSPGRRGFQNEAALALSKNPELVDKERQVQDEITEKAWDNIEGYIEDKLNILKKSEHARVKSSVLWNKSVFFERVQEIGQQWEKQRNLAIINIEDEIKLTERLVEINETFNAMVQAVVKSADFFVSNITDNTWVTEETLKRMETEGPKIVEVLRNDEELIETLHWSMGWVDEGSSLGAAEEKHFAVLAGKLNNEPDKKPLVWTILKQMSSEQQTRFGIDYFTKLNGTFDRKQFFVEANNNGVFGASVIRDINNALNKEKEQLHISAEDMEQFAVTYEHCTNFEKAAQAFLPSIGATNPAGEMMTLKNAGLLIVEAGAYFSIFSNLVVGASGGGWKDPFNLVHEYTLGGAALAYGARSLRTHNSMGKDFESKESRDSNTMVKARKSMRDLMDKPAWGGENGFFGSDPNNYSAFRSFIESVVGEISTGKDEEIELPERLFTKTEFKKHLEELAQKEPDLYGGTLSNFNDISGRVKNSDIFKFAQIFDSLHIGGSEVEARAKFQNNLEEAKKQHA